MAVYEALTIVIYIAIAIAVYYVVKSLLIANLDYSEREDRELAEDTSVISCACALVSAMWIVYIPYMILRIVLGKTELE